MSKNKIDLLRRLLYEGKINNEYFQSQMAAVLNGVSTSAAPHINFSDSIVKSNTRGYSNRLAHNKRIS